MSANVGNSLPIQEMELAPVGAAAVGEKDVLGGAEEGFVGEPHGLVQADGGALRVLGRAEQAGFARLGAVFDGPGAVRVVCLHQVADGAHGIRTSRQGQGVLHFDEGDIAHGGVDACAPVDGVRFEVALQRPRRRLRCLGAEGRVVGFDEGLQHAAVVRRQPPELGVAVCRFDFQERIEAVIRRKRLVPLAQLVGGNCRQRDADHYPQQTEVQRGGA
jgi:hypothetical protein